MRPYLSETQLVDELIGALEDAIADVDEDLTQLLEEPHWTTVKKSRYS